MKKTTSYILLCTTILISTFTLAAEQTGDHSNTPKDFSTRVRKLQHPSPSEESTPVKDNKAKEEFILHLRNFEQQTRTPTIPSRP